mgnify:FL=1
MGREIFITCRSDQQRVKTLYKEDGRDVKTKYKALGQKSERSGPSAPKHDMPKLCPSGRSRLHEMIRALALMAYIPALSFRIVFISKGLKPGRLMVALISALKGGVKAWY